MAQTVRLDLLDRLRDALDDERLTEAELRTLTEEADAVIRVSIGQVAASERRLEELTEDGAPSLAEVAAELQRVERARRTLRDAQALQVAFAERAHELRAAWLLHQT